jgi:hypothetical protein
MLANVLNSRALADLSQKGLAIDDASVGIGVQEIFCKIGIEPADVSLIDRAYIVRLRSARVALWAFSSVTTASS